MEAWKDIEGYEGKYQVSNDGRVRTSNYYGKNTIKELNLLKDRDGYYRISLYFYGSTKPKNTGVHRLVALAFIPNPNNLSFVCHKNDNPSDNNVNNLFWGSHLDNEKDKARKRRHAFIRTFKCEYCGNVSNLGNYYQHHGPNCKSKPFPASYIL